MLCDSLIDKRQAAGSDLQGIGANDSTEQAGNTTDVPFVDGRKRSTVVLQNMGTVSATGDTGLVFEGAWNINYSF